MEIKASLKTVLKRLKLSGILYTLPDRIAYANKAKLSHQDLLELVLQDEIDRREQVSLNRRLEKAQFEEEQTFENFNWDAPVTFDRDRVRDLIAGNTMLKELHQSRGDHTTDKALRRLISPDLLIVDDFGLRALDHTQSSDMYEVIIERHKRSSTILTSNRHVDEWVPLFADPVLSQSALDRLAHNAHQIVIEGETYRGLRGPGAQYRGQGK